MVLSGAAPAQLRIAAAQPFLVIWPQLGGSPGVVRIAGTARVARAPTRGIRRRASSFVFGGEEMEVMSLRTVRRVVCMAMMVGAWAAATAGPIEVIYTEIPGHPTAVVPGARDAGGQPVFAEFLALQDLAVSHDGSQWVVKGTCNLGSSLDALLVLGSGKAGTVLAQDGQPLQGGLPGELYDFFDSPVPAAWDEAGNLAFSCRARGGSSSVYEKVIVVDAATQTHTVVIQMGQPALGLIDRPPNPSGDELFGNSINSVYLLNDGRVAFVNTPIQNCHSTRYPAFFRGNTAFKQSGVSAIRTEIWDNFDYDDCGGTPDGLHWFAKGDTENPSTAIDDILAVDDQIVLQEGSPVAPGSTVSMAAIFFTRMLSDGTWFCRGDDPLDNDWAVRNGELLAKTGDLIAGDEHWGDSFGAFTGNRVGDWLLAGNTDNPDTTQDYVLVLNGNRIVARENDAVDLDGDGDLDDDAYIASFQPNDLYLTDDRTVYFLATLRNSEGTALGDAFLRLSLRVIGDLNCDGHVNVFDIDPFVQALVDPAGYAAAYPHCDYMLADVNHDGAVNVFDIDPFVACLVE